MHQCQGDDQMHQKAVLVGKPRHLTLVDILARLGPDGEYSAAPKALERRVILGIELGIFA